MEIGLGPGDTVLDGDPAPPPKGAQRQLFGPCLLWPNGWMDQDAAWYRGRSLPKPHCVRWGDTAPTQKGGTSSPTTFWPLCIMAKWSPISATVELLFLKEP